MNKFALIKSFIIKKVDFKFKLRNLNYKLSNNSKSKGSANIVYILHCDQKVRSGGDKVTYKQSEIINKLNEFDVKSSVLHFGNTAMKFDWFKHSVAFKRDYKFDSNNDFAVIPEIMVIPHAEMLSGLGIKYAIFVQGGYIMDAYSQNYHQMSLAYKNASLILAISEDVVKCIATAYPWATDKVVRISYSINADKFKFSETKQNLITYMPRKLTRHANLIKFFIKERLPKNWELKEIHGLDENGVIEILGKSKIFISTSELEGCPMPPVEAALCGNYVIGYTGEGGKEYWKSPIFTEVYCGDIKNFVNQILMKIEQLNTSSFDVDFETSRMELANTYSENTEKQSLLNFISRVEKILYG